MDCPNCGTDVKGVSLIYNIVKVTIHNCPQCRREWHVVLLTKEAGRPELVEVLEKTHRKQAQSGSDILRKIIWYLESKIDAMLHDQSDPGQRKRKMDLQDRQFLKQATDEVY